MFYKNLFNKREIFGWSTYDFANTIFSSLFITVYFPLFVTLKGGTAFHVGLVMSTSMVLAGLTVPISAAVAFGFKQALLVVIGLFFAGAIVLSFVKTRRGGLWDECYIIVNL
tara:strand:+ start:204 stop:539 length:336 start_codon:yes stop_codon:yes gene_type:complete